MAGGRDLLRREIEPGLVAEEAGPMGEIGLDENGRERELFWWWFKSKWIS
jgi:hypothetical protein